MASKFDCSIFKNPAIISDNQTAVIFKLNGKRFMGLNGGPQFNFTEALSGVVVCETQEEIDHYWDHPTLEGESEGRCGWSRDKFEVYWTKEQKIEQIAQCRILIY
ncbi:VOC family protein [Flavobacteriaceae bacterium F89]|uniref:VOC family protein n=1 Tax=Cerina litoralis TaxID=2874477 RepID=A0AAE3ES52_9FLAO|nr:VOC family protein [Cerina litoralis]MCG2459169.1 VOC family protein [Cerina litoralis]